MKWLHISAIAQAMWLALIPVWLALAPTVWAAETANCSELGATNRWQGHQASTTTGQRHGAQAIFEDWSLVQCTNPGLVEASGSFVFANVVPTDGTSLDIIQIGAGNCRAPNCPGGMQYYAANGLSHHTPGCSTFQDTAPILRGWGAWSPGNHIYRVEHSTNFWRVFVDQTQKASLAEGSLCWTPRSSVWFGESWDYGDQIGGTPTDRLSITQASYMTSEGSAWVATSFNASAGCSYAGSSGIFNCDVTGTRSLDIWTDR
jgi:hypothetical protein